MQSGKAQVYLLGWTGDFGDPANFAERALRTPSTRSSGFNNPTLFKLLSRPTPRRTWPSGRSCTSRPQIHVMKFLPMVPYVHTKPALAFQKNVHGLHPEPGLAGAVRDRLHSS